MQSKNALNNLIKRYKAVLKKCHILNTFGSLLMFSMLSLGAAHALMHPNMAVAASGVEEIQTDGTASDANNGNYTLNTDIIGGADPDVVVLKLPIQPQVKIANLPQLMTIHLPLMLGVRRMMPMVVMFGVKVVTVVQAQMAGMLVLSMQITIH